MKNSTRAFIQDLDRKDIRYLIEREGVNDETDMVSIQYEGVNMNQIRTSVFLSDINAGYRIFSIAKVPNEKRQKVLEKINELHNKWRWVSFAIDEDSELCSRLDVFYSENDIEIYAQALYQIVDINIIKKLNPLFYETMVKKNEEKLEKEFEKKWAKSGNSRLTQKVYADDKKKHSASFKRFADKFIKI